MRRLVLALLAGSLMLWGFAPAARGDAADDFRAVAADYRADSKITPCAFTRAQLVNAVQIYDQLGELQYYGGDFRNAVLREIRRHDDGGCRGISPRTPESIRAASKLAKLKIVRIRPRGGLAESVTIRNTGARRVSLKGATLRDRSGRRVRLAGRLGARRSLRVVTGCAKGRRRSARIGARLFSCRPKRVWDDRGDVVKIVDARRVVVRQRGYGRLRGVVRF